MTATSSITSPSGSSNLTAVSASRFRVITPRGLSRSRSASPGGEGRHPADSHARARFSSGSPCRPGRGKPRVRPVSLAYEKLLSQETECRRVHTEIYIPPGPRLGDVVIDFRDVTKGYDDRLLFEKLSFQMPPGVNPRHDRPQRRGEDHAAPAGHRPGAARRRIDPDRPDRQAGLRGSEPGHPGQRKERVGGDHGRGADFDARASAP